MAYIRRFTSDPGNTVLTNIEAIDIIDLPPPSTISGTGTGTVLIVGEFEDGPFVPTEVFGATDLLNTFGGLGFLTNGLNNQNPCCTSRTADSLAAEYWNGNGFVALAGKAFSRLLIQRVNTSLGSVTFTPISAMTATTVVPAGTVCTATSGATPVVTMQDLTFALGATAAQTVLVRAAQDDGTYAGAISGAIDVSTNGLFTVSNAGAITAALSESAIDALYVTAIANTVDLNGVSHDTNIIVSARQSNAVRAEVLANALAASAGGCFGRMGCVRPPLGTTRTVAKQSGAPGVQATASERVVYCYPGISEFLPSVAALGTAGGTGFTASGLVDAGSDVMMASILSQLNPEENPGQTTTLTANMNGLESSANAQGFLMADYISFKGIGIAAPRVDTGVLVFQSGITSVNPTIYPNLVTIARRRMADYIQDSISTALQPFSKKLMTFSRRKAIASEIRAFMDGLLSKNNPDVARIAAYNLDETSGNSPSTLALGIFRLILQVQTLASINALVLQTEIGESVTITQTS